MLDDEKVKYVEAVEDLTVEELESKKKQEQLQKWLARLDEKKLKFRHIFARFQPGWGKEISIAPGWDNLILELDRALAEIDPDYKVQQIKEKFGGLRYYCTMSDQPQGRFAMFYTDRFEALRRQAEQQSYVTCELCGGSAITSSKNGWYSTLCQKCGDER